MGYMTKVEIFTSARCPYCTWAKKLLDKKGAPYEEIRIDTGDTKERGRLQARTEYTSVPQIFIDGAHIGGYQEMINLDRAGQLDRMLKP